MDNSERHVEHWGIGKCHNMCLRQPLGTRAAMAVAVGRHILHRGGLDTYELPIIYE